MMFRLSILGGICVPGGYLPKLEGKVMTIEYRVSIPQGLEPFPLLCWSLCHPRSGVDPEFFHGKKSLKSRYFSNIFCGQISMSIKTHLFFKLGWFSQKPHRCWNILVMLKLFHAVSSHCSTANLLPS